MKGLLQCSANYIPLTPLSFLERAALVYGDKASIIYGTIRFSWKQTHRRCVKLASALVQLGISPLDVVAAFAPNVPALYELHFGVPMAGAILSALNTRLDATTLAAILDQLEAKIVLVDYQFVDVLVKALDQLSQRKCMLSTKNQKRKCKLPIIVLIPECDHQTSTPSWINLEDLPNGSLNYDQLLSMGKADEFETILPNNECDPISVNYTSGTTGYPKGVVYSHRAVYLKSIGTILNIEMRPMPVFLWTVDMFRCNGWCFPWTIAALGGTNVCLRTFSAKVIFDSIALHGVTHICGKPTILNIIAGASDTSEQVPSAPLQSSVEIIVAGALPVPQILTRVMELGFIISHGYGMTEVLGPAIITPCKLPGKQLHSLMLEGVDVKDSKTMESVPYDGKTMGEIMFKGNTMMLGYLKNSSATKEACKGGWYRTGDIGIRHPDGDVQMKDRAKDIIISNGEVISSLEVETVLLSNPKVSEAAVVGRNVGDDCLGTSGGSNSRHFAFVKLKEGCSASSKEIIKFCGENLPPYMVPHDAIFGDLPVNSTGKVQKFVLRDKANVL
ncbi:hypothetical protein FNV43_RR18668 [Rhamnella rubrinervis]|uniref:Acyl-activating enzyme 1, peroxisomal n=1 Tax=Rhamnella rubrinervis TaxID=2594499 RepID=A0A8K0E6B3_9ROSA|nr:hypothetical protein FNV43_RR18668 [Rhamnella rubrinervis]